MPVHFSFQGPGLWYATRATGLVAFLLLTLCVALGLVTAVRYTAPKLPRFVTVGLHRNTSLLAVVFLALHVLTTVADSYTPIALSAAFVPFSANYRTFWLGLGAVASDLLIALIATSLVRLRLGYRTWRAVHWLAYACWPVALVHALGTGTDPASAWMSLITVLCVTCVVCAIGWRIAAGWPARKGVRLGAAAATVAVVLALGAWALSGPLAPHWSQRAVGARTASGLRSAGRL
jgi:methionine sulfoxide reductase heme-binding subunit